MMQKTGIFVNISRGDVVDEHALIDALQQGRIAGAGLDVYEFEPKVPVALMALENVTLLPHLGTACLEVRETCTRPRHEINVIAPPPPPPITPSIGTAPRWPPSSSADDSGSNTGPPAWPPPVALVLPPLP